MSGVLPILVSTPARRRVLACACLSALAGLAACGQKGPLFLPTGEAAAGRASLPE
ncbi:MAG TPA: lipoprotein, partial [Ramlibacter sp.]